MGGLRRIPAHRADGVVLLLEPGEVFWLTTDGHDTLIRTRRKHLYRSTRRLADLARVLPSPPFFRCHESFVVNVDRVRSVEPRGRDYELRMDPPVNTLLPLARSRVAAFRRLTGAP